MVTLYINNSMSRLEGLTGEQTKALRQLLSYQPDTGYGYAKSRFPKARKYLMTARGEFPTGLLHLVKEYLGKSVMIIDARKPPEALKTRFALKLTLTPRVEQLEASKAAKNASRGVICAPTGSGKSVIIALIINELQVNTLIVVPSLELRRQLTEGLKSAFGDNVVGRLGSPIAVENIDALDPKKILSGYGCLIIDEFHRSGASTYQKLNRKAWGNIYYRIGLTATPFRNKDEESILLEAILSQRIYEIPYQTAVNKGYIVPLEAYYYALPKLKTEGYTWAQIYKELVVDNGARNALIAELLTKLKGAGLSTLLLVKEIAHGERLKELTSTHFANGINEDSQLLIQAFSNKRIDALIGTTGVLGEGIDTRAAEFVIIAGLGKSRPAFIQQIGRVFRNFQGKTSCKVILFKDTSHKWTAAHFKAQCKILLDDFGVIPIELKL